MAGARRDREKAGKGQARVSAKVLQIRKAINRFLSKTQRIVKAVAPHARLVRGKPVRPRGRPRLLAPRKEYSPDAVVLTKAGQRLQKPPEPQTQISVPQFRGKRYEGRNQLF